jgi:hypothetical protein
MQFLIRKVEWLERRNNFTQDIYEGFFKENAGRVALRENLANSKSPSNSEVMRIYS